MNTKQSAEEAAKQIEEPVKWTYQTVESLYGCTLNPLAAVKVADAHNAAIEKADEQWRERFRKFEKIEEKFGPASQRAAHASEPIICPYCQIEQDTIGGFIAHLKLLHPLESEDAAMSQTKEKPMNTQQITEEAEASFNARVLNITNPQSPTRAALRNAFQAAIEKAKKQWIANLPGEKKHSMGEGANEAQRLRAHISKYAAHASEKGSQ